MIPSQALGGIIAEHFARHNSINCYVSSNAATPTTLLESLTQAITARDSSLPFMRMVHLRLQGPIPFPAPLPTSTA